MKFHQQAGRLYRFGGSGPDQWLDDLVDYAAHFDPDLPGKLEGATPEQLARLEELAGQPLPPTYRAWLERMGQRDGGLLYELKADLDINEVLELYEDTDEDERPADCLMIGAGQMGTYAELSLKPMPQGEPQLIHTDGRWVGKPIAQSLPRFLLQQAFQRYELGSYPVRQYYGLVQKLHTLQRVQRAATAAKVTPYWFSDAWNLCGWAEGAVLAAHQDHQGAGWLVVGGVDAAHAAQLGDALDHALGLRFQRKLVDVPE